MKDLRRRILQIDIQGLHEAIIQRQQRLLMQQCDEIAYSVVTWIVKHVVERGKTVAQAGQELSRDTVRQLPGLKSRAVFSSIRMTAKSSFARCANTSGRITLRKGRNTHAVPSTSPLLSSWGALSFREA